MLIFTSFYLELCIWPDVISRWIWERVCIKFCANLVKCAMETLAMIRQAFWGGKHETYMDSPNSPRLKNVEQVKSKGYTHNFLSHQGDWSQRIRPSRPNSQFHILLWRFAATAWNCAKTSPQTLATKELAVASRQVPSHTSFFTRELSTRNNITVVLHPPHFFMFPGLKIKLKGSHFDII
jgi:hypothetical protein